MRRAAIVLPLLFLALALLPSSTEARQFMPCQTVQVADTTPGATSNITYSYGLGVGPDCVRGTDDDVRDYRQSALVQFTPGDWGVAHDSDLPDGTKIGTFSLRDTISLFNNGCNIALTVPADLFDGTTDVSNSISPDPRGRPDRLAPIAGDANQNGIPDAAEHWPSYLTDLAASQGWDPANVISRAVAVNTTVVEGAAQVINILTFARGATLGTHLQPDSRLGYPMLVVINDPTDPATPEDPLSDACTPFTLGWTFFGEAEGHSIRTNPPDGLYDFTTYTRAQPDADDDGIDNTLDPCPFVPDTSWDPAANDPPGQGAPGDMDGDGLPDFCDPNPTVMSTCTAATAIPNSDEDCDGWMNRADNCPLVPNADQADADGDSIGDACDDTPNAVSGNLHTWCNVDEITIGAGGYNSVWPGWLHPCALAAGAGDGNCDGESSTADVLAALSELAGTYSNTLCTSQVTCDEPLTALHVLYLLKSIAQAGYILRPCDFNGGPPQ